MLGDTAVNQSFLDEIKSEIDLMDPLAFSPLDKIKEGENVIFQVEDLELMKIYATAMMYDREEKQRKLNLRYLEDDSQRENEIAAIRRYSYFSGVLFTLFWMALDVKYKVPKQGALGIRKGWQIVDRSNTAEFKAEQNPMRDMFRGMFGGFEAD